MFNLPHRASPRFYFQRRSGALILRGAVTNFRIYSRTESGPEFRMGDEFTPPHTFLLAVSPSDDTMSELADVRTRKRIELRHDDYSLIRPHSAVRSEPRRAAGLVAFATEPDATGGDDRTVRLSHTSTGRALLAFTDLPQRVNSVAFSPDGLRLAAALHDGSVLVWSTVE